MANTGTSGGTFSVSADNYSFTESAFLASSDLVAPTIIQLNVTANDSVGKNAQIWSVDDGINSAKDLLTSDVAKNGQVSFWTQDLMTAKGNELRIINGKVQLDITHSLALLGYTSVDQLTTGQVITDSFTYAVKNATTGQLVWTTVNFSLSGEGMAANTVAVIEGIVSVQVNEEGDSLSPGDWLLFVTDPDPGQAGLKPLAPAQLQGRYGSFQFHADGNATTWTYTVNSALPEVQALAGSWFDGSRWHSSTSLEDSLDVTSIDGTAGTTVFVTITGTNDAATINGETTGQHTATLVDNGDLLEATGRLTVMDVDSGQSSLRIPTGATLVLAGKDGATAPPQYALTLAHGTLRLTPSTGDWRYIADTQAIAALHGDESMTDRVTLESLDGSASRELVFNLQGVDNTATLSGTFTGAYTEGAGRSFFPSGKILVTDPDHDQAVLRLPDGAFKTSDTSGGTGSGTVDGGTVKTTFVSKLESVTTTGTGTTAPTDLYGVKLAHGVLILSPSTGRWQFVADEKALDSLWSGETAEDRLTLSSLDGSAQQDLVISFQGSDDMATFSGDATGSVVEDAVLTNSAYGILVVTDPDHDQSAFAAPQDGDLVKGSTYAIKTPYGLFFFNQKLGNWSFELDNGSTAVQSLGEGKTAEASFHVKSIDGSADQTVKVTLTGVNDLAGFDGTQDLQVMANAKDPVSGQVSVEDADAGESAFQADTSLQGQYGFFTFSSTGSKGTWTYTVDARNPTVLALQGGKGDTPPETLTETMQVLSADGKSTLTLSATIVGVDEKPLPPMDMGSVTEDVKSAPLVMRLPDGFAPTGTLPLKIPGQFGSFVVSLDVDEKGNSQLIATYTFSEGGEAVQKLVEKEMATDTVTLPGAGGQDLQLLVSVNGVNDLATITGPSTQPYVAEDDSMHVEGFLQVEDKDSGEAGLRVVGSDTSFVTATGEVVNLGEFRFDPATRAWSYDMDPATKDGLASGEKAQQVLTLESTDGLTRYDLTVRVTGKDDPAGPITGRLSADVTEDGQTGAWGQIAVGDPDWSQQGFQHGKLEGTYGNFTFDNASGKWTYTLHNDNPAVQALGSKDVRTDRLMVGSFDGASNADIVVTIHGAAEPPTIQGVMTGQVTEDDVETAKGQLLVSQDTDGTYATAFNAVSEEPGRWGHFSLLENGHWYYLLDQSPAVQALTAADVFFEQFTVSTTDGGASKSVEIEVHGSDDTPTLKVGEGALTGQVQEDGSTQSIGGLLWITDADAGQSALQAAAYGDFAGQYGTFHLAAEGAAGNGVRWTYTLDNQAAQSLRQVDSATDTFTLTAKDGTTLGELAIRVDGQDDMPSLSGVFSATIAEDSDPGTLSGHITLRDPEARLGGLFAAPAQYGDFSLERSGDGWNWAYRLDNSLSEVDLLTGAAGESPLVESIDLFEEQGLYVSIPLETLSITIQGHDDPTFALPSQVTKTEDDLGQYTGAKTSRVVAVTGVDGSTGGEFSTGTVGYVGWDGHREAVWSANTFSGQIAFLDSDTTAPFVAQDEVRGTGGYGYFSVTASGAWTWVSDGPHDEFDGGKTYTDSLTVHTASGQTTTVSVVIAGVNDLSEFGGDNKTVTQGDSAADLSASGTIPVNDPDTPAAFIPLVNAEGDWGTFNVDSGGHWTYTAHTAMQWLLAGETAIDQVHVYNTDGDYGIVAVFIEGTDDPTVIHPTDVSLTEGNSADDLWASGTIAWDDPDYLAPVGSGEVNGSNDGPAPIVFQDGTFDGLYGSLTVHADGTWTYAGDDAHDELAGGQEYLDTFTVTADNGTPEGATGTLVVKITGTDDLPTIVPATITVKESQANEPLTVLSTSSLDDPDGGPALTFLPVNPAGAGWVLNHGNGEPDKVQTGINWGEFSFTNGAWTYMPNVETLHLSGTATFTDTLLVHTQDGQEALLTVVIQGEDTPTVLQADIRAAFTEDSAGQVPLTGSVLAEPDLDSPNPIGAYSRLGLYGNFVLESNGNWTYTPDASLVDPLVPGQVVTDTFGVKSLDGHKTLVTITITGADDPLVKFNTSASISLTEGDSAAALSSSGKLMFTDPDTLNPFVATTQVGQWGTFTLSATGDWTYTSSSAHDDLRAGEEVYELFETHLRPDLLVADGALRDGLFKVAILGTGEAPKYGTPDDDTLVGSADHDRLYGGAGNDTLRGNAGDDLLEGGAGYDTLIGGAGDDILRGLGSYFPITSEDLAAGDTYIDGLGRDIMDASTSKGSNTFDTVNAGSTTDSTLIRFGSGDNYAVLGVGRDTLVLYPDATLSSVNSASGFDMSLDKVRVDTTAFHLGTGGALLTHATSDGIGLYYNDGATEKLMLDLVGLQLPEGYDFLANNVTTFNSSAAT
jgi:VCBS repeat-containing protein